MLSEFKLALEAVLPEGLLDCAVLVLLLLERLLGLCVPLLKNALLSIQITGLLREFELKRAFCQLRDLLALPFIVILL